MWVVRLRKCGNSRFAAIGINKWLHNSKCAICFDLYDDRWREYSRKNRFFSPNANCKTGSCLTHFDSATEQWEADSFVRSSTKCCINTISRNSFSERHKMEGWLYRKHGVRACAAWRTLECLQMCVYFYLLTFNTRHVVDCASAASATDSAKAVRLRPLYLKNE